MSCERQLLVVLDLYVYVMNMSMTLPRVSQRGGDVLCEERW